MIPDLPAVTTIPTTSIVLNYESSSDENESLSDENESDVEIVNIQDPEEKQSELKPVESVCCLRIFLISTHLFISGLIR